MGDASSTFDINIRTAADVQGVRSVRQELVQVTKATSEASAAGNALALAHDKAGEASGRLGHSSSNLRLATRGANDAAWAITDLLNGEYVVAFHRARGAVEDLGIAMRTAFAPAAIITGITLGVEALSHLVFHLDETKELYKQTGQEAKHAADEIEDASKRSQKSLEALRKYLEEAPQAAKDLRKSEDELGDAQLAEKLASLDEKVAKGEMKESDAQRSRATLRAANERDRYARQIGEARANIVRLGEEMDYLHGQQESNRYLAVLKQRMDETWATSAGFTASTGAVNLSLLDKYTAAKDAYEQKRRSIDVTPEEAEKRLGELSQKLSDEKNQIAAAEARQRAAELNKAAENAKITAKEKAEQDKQREEVAIAERDAQKQSLEKMKASVSADLAEAEAKKDPTSEKFREQVNTITKLKQKLLDLTEQIEILNGAEPDNATKKSRRETLEFDAIKDVTRAEIKADAAAAKAEAHEQAGETAGVGAAHGRGARHALPLVGPDGGALPEGAAWTGGARGGAPVYGARGGPGGHNGKDGLVSGGLRTGHIQGASMVGEGTDFDAAQKFQIPGLDRGSGTDFSSEFQFQIDTSPHSRRSTLPPDEQAALAAGDALRHNPDALPHGLSGELSGAINKIKGGKGVEGSDENLLRLMQELSDVLKQLGRPDSKLDKAIEDLRHAVSDLQGQMRHNNS